MAKKKKQTIGYKYFASGHFILCHGPIDAITKISFQDKDAYLQEETENKTIYINRSGLFGGDEQSGGIQGNVELLFGRPDQQKSITLQQICAKISNSFNGLISAYRGVCSIVFNNVYIGTSPSMPDSKWRVKRVHTRHDGEKQWYDEKAEINAFSLNANIDKQYKYFVKDGFTALSQLGSYAAVNYDDSLWQVGQGPFGNNLGPKTNVDPHAGRAIMIREKISVINAGLIGDLIIKIRHDDGGVVYWNGEKIDLVVDEFLNSTARISQSKINEGDNILFAAAVDAVPAGSATGIYLEVSYSSVYATSIESDINPTHIIRECLTNKFWGIGVSESSIDDSSFRKAADTLYAEKMGMSIKWTDSTSISEFVDNIKEHINAQLYLDRITNKWKLYLIREDYNTADLIPLDESNIRNLDFERRTLAECVNTVTVTYWDRERSKDSTVTVQDIARIAQQGGVIAQSIDYKGFTNSDLASRIALRDLKTLSSTLATVSFDVDESFSETWHEGMPFKLSDTNYGLSEAVMRIRTIKRGDGINNSVYVEAVEDSFSSSMQSVVEYIPPISSNDYEAKNATSLAFEVPYIELVEQFGEDNIDLKLTNYPDVGYVGMAAIRPNNNHINANLYINSGAGYDERNTIDFCPNAELKNDIGYMDTSFELTNVFEFELIEFNQRIQVNDEIMCFVNFNNNTKIITVKRGCFDTVPQKHESGSNLFGWDNYSGIDETDYLSGEILTLKALTLTGSNILDLNKATTHQITLNARAIRPYPPAKVKINNQFYPTSFNDNLTITWVDRNRLHQTGGEALSYFDDGIQAESGTSYRLIITEYGENGDELRTQSLSLTEVNSHTFLKSEMNIDTKLIQIVLRSLRDDYESFQSFQHVLENDDHVSAPYNLMAVFSDE